MGNSMIDWHSVLESGALTSDVVKSAKDWRYCPVGLRFPQFVGRIHGAYDVTRDCPLKLTKLGMQFMDCVEAGEKAKALGILGRIERFAEGRP